MGQAAREPLEIESFTNQGNVSFRITTERGIRATGEANIPPRASAGTAIVVVAGSRGPQKGAASVAAEIQRSHSLGFATLTISDSRVTPREVTGVAPVAGVADHNPAEWGLWVGRPLLGQWTWDVIRWLDFLDEQSVDRGGESWRPRRPYVVIGLGAMSLPALLAGALDSRVGWRFVRRVSREFCRSRNAKPWSGIPMGLLAPGILEVGDVGQLAALLAPGRLCYQGRSSRMASRRHLREFGQLLNLLAGSIGY